RPSPTLFPYTTLFRSLRPQRGLRERRLRVQPQANRLTVYVARRVALAVLVVAGVVVLTFVIAHLVPGDPAATWAGPHASAAQVRSEEHTSELQSLTNL